MRTLTCCLAALLLATSGSVLEAHERELILAGGALRTCSSLSARECTDPARVSGAAFRGPARYAFEPAAVDAALDPRLWRLQPTRGVALAQVLDDARARHHAAALSAREVDDALATRCVDAGQVFACAADDARAPWSHLDDDARAAVLAALELPQRNAHGARRRETADLHGSRSPHGVAVLRAFVAAARERAGGRTPRVAIVTASAFDPFDPVDFYLDALRDAGAQPQWWPLDAALAEAVFARQDCAALPALRVERLRLPARERVYPDLVAAQAAACAAPESLVRVPQEVQGVFFAGGDQWKLRRAFFGADDRGDDQPNPWLHALREAVASGGVVIGGTSAGSAVQSGGPMLTSGTPANALRHGAVASAPPVPGCGRSGDCVGGLDEDAFTFWPAGGLGLAPGMIVDTHFSERARETRLLRLLVDTGTRWGVGADETSALHLRWRAEGAIDAQALGASGGWVFDAAPGCAATNLRAQVHYLAPGATARLGARGVELVTDATASADVEALSIAPPTRSVSAPLKDAHEDPLEDALVGGTLRAAAQALAAGGDAVRLRAGADGATATLTRTPATRVWRDPGATYASVIGLQLDIEDIDHGDAASAATACDSREAQATVE